MYSFTSNPKSFLKISMPPKSEEIKKHNDYYANMYHKLAYNFPHYYKMYFNVTFFILITPFRLSFNGKSAKVVTNPVQMVLCAIVHFGVCVLGFLWIRREVDSKIKDKPELLFTIASYLTWAWYIVIYVGVFWSKKVFSILNIPYHPFDRKIAFKGTLIIFLGVLMLLFYYATEVVFTDTMEVKPVLDNFATTALYMTFQNRNKSDTPVFNELSGGKQAVVLCIFVVDLYYNTIISFLELYGFISTLAAFEVICTVSPVFLSGKVTTLRILLQNYADMKEVLGKINRVNGNILLIIFIQIIPWISGSLIEFLDEEKWPSKIFMMLYHCFYVGLLGVAAEVYRKAKMFKKRIYVLQRIEMQRKDYTYQDLSYVNLYLKGTLGDTGLTGGNFFVVTYSFLGTSISVLMTFSMIMVQFKSSINHTE